MMNYLLNKNVSSKVLLILLCVSSFSAILPTECISHEWPTNLSANPVLSRGIAFERKGNGSAARSIYERILKQNQHTTEAHFGLYRLALQEGDSNRAQRRLETILKHDPNNASALAELGHLFQQKADNPFTGDPTYANRAEEYFKQAHTLNPNNLSLLIHQGEWFLAHNDTVSARKRFQKAIKLKPDSVAAHQGIIKYYMATDQPQKATDAILFATESEPNNHTNYFLMAQLLSAAGHPDKAVKYGLKSEELDYGTNAQRDYFLAQQFNTLGNRPRSIEYFEKIHQLAPNHRDTIKQLATLYETEGQIAKSQQLFKQLVQKDPRYTQNLMNQANAQLREEETAQAIPQYIHTLNINPKRVSEIMERIASAIYIDHFLHRSNPDRIKQALEIFENIYGNPGKPVTPSVTLSHIKLHIAEKGAITPVLRSTLEHFTRSRHALASGEAHFLLGNHQRAMERLDAVDGITAKGYQQVGDRLLSLQAIEAAAIMYQRGAQISPLPGIAQGMERIADKKALAERRLQEGNGLFTRKEYAKAIIKYEEARTIVPHWDSVYLRLGDTHDRLKHRIAAYKNYERATQLSPHLINSKGFAKRYRKLQKKAQKAAQKQGIQL